MDINMLSKIILIVGAMSLTFGYVFDFIAPCKKGGGVFLAVTFACFFMLAALLSSAL